MTDSYSDPIGRLIVEAEKRAKKKASKEHTEPAKCGCQVRVYWFSENSRTVSSERCHEHEVPFREAQKKARQTSRSR